MSEPFSSLRPVVQGGVGAVAIVIGSEEYVISQLSARELAFGILRSAASAEVLEGVWVWIDQRLKLTPERVYDYQDLAQLLGGLLEQNRQEQEHEGDGHEH